MFRFNYDKRFLYILIGIMVAISITQYVQNPEDIIQLILTLPAVLIAITFHEFAHAYVAYKLGDDTPKNQGRISLNPFAHLDPIGTVLLIFAGFGWGKPVQVNPRNYTRKMSMNAGDALVSAAGPIMNFILAIIFAIIYTIIVKINPMYTFTKVGMVVSILIQVIITINIGLGVFNLIPLPPLDGSKILKNFLPYKGRQWMETNEQICYIIFVAIWVTGIASKIIGPITVGIYSGLMKLLFMIFGM